MLTRRSFFGSVFACLVAPRVAASPVVLHVQPLVIPPGVSFSRPTLSNPDPDFDRYRAIVTEHLRALQRQR